MAPITEPARVFLYLSGKDFISVTSKTLKVPCNTKSSICVNKFEFDKTKISIYQVTYGKNYCNAYCMDMDMEPELFYCVDDQTKECVLTVYKPTRRRIQDIKILEYQLGKYKACLFGYSNIDRIIENVLESAYGRIKSKTSPNLTLLDIIFLGIPLKE